MSNPDHLAKAQAATADLRLSRKRTAAGVIRGPRTAYGGLVPRVCRITNR
jgi:hypothetical protein